MIIDTYANILTVKAQHAYILILQSKIFEWAKAILLSSLSKFRAWA